MKFKIIEPFLIGCAFCSPVPNVKLDKTILLNEQYGDSIYFTGYDKKDREVYCPPRDKGETLEDYTKRHADFINDLYSLTVTIESALHGEIYELDKSQNEFYLVGRTEGWT